MVRAAQAKGGCADAGGGGGHVLSYRGARTDACRVETHLDTLLRGTTSTRASRKVVLFLPPYAGKVLGPPLSLLSLAGSLREAGYVPCLIDGALDRNFPRTVAREID